VRRSCEGSSALKAGAGVVIIIREAAGVWKGPLPVHAACRQCSASADSSRAFRHLQLQQGTAWRPFQSSA